MWRLRLSGPGWLSLSGPGPSFSPHELSCAGSFPTSDPCPTFPLAAHHHHHHKENPNSSCSSSPSPAGLPPTKRRPEPQLWRKLEESWERAWPAGASWSGPPRRRSPPPPSEVERVQLSPASIPVSHSVISDSRSIIGTNSCERGFWRWGPCKSRSPSVGGWLAWLWGLSRSQKRAFVLVWIPIPPRWETFFFPLSWWP